ncbi:lysozyme [Actinosynnema mirum]|uniref:Lysozyme n=1 Tax=Actinosynnema mirum (strain ATCC 29888 / DSM 43827 / JCM 3225 / NBRC 14064 / NCIMB 13271 / NRRL B-12336 / IMRU 3971 / 101) TaxID=446462 RepID=C6WQX7_ACTMD|nr:lysozyme [Actinosynnema mirum]ACU40670.1 Lysozyme [Actinosynnema mirum DSM 43827]
MRPLVRRAVAALACAAAALSTSASPALALPEGDHAMGSQIAKHEGAAARHVEPRGPSAAAAVYGIDVSSYQGNVDWGGQWNAGRRFAYVKATEGTTYKNPYFAQQYDGSYGVGMIRGAYHFALPANSSGAAQANHFASNGGGWSRDGRTLPGALDMEYNPYGSTCYGLSPSAMTNWIKDFSDTYRARTGVYPVIYTSTSWWNQCVSGDFSGTNPLWVARYASTVGTLPRGWSVYTMWQYSSSPIDQNEFNGGYDRLQALAYS